MPIWDFQNWIRTWGGNRDFFMSSKKHSPICFCSPSFPMRLICIPDEELKGIPQMKLLMPEGLGIYSSIYYGELYSSWEAFSQPGSKWCKSSTSPLEGWWMKNLLLLMGIGLIETLSESLESPTISAWDAERKEGRRFSAEWTVFSYPICQYWRVYAQWWNYHFSFQFILIWASEVMTRILQADETASL